MCKVVSMDSRQKFSVDIYLQFFFFFFPWERHVFGLAFVFRVSFMIRPKFFFLNPSTIVTNVVDRNSLFFLITQFQFQFLGIILYLRSFSINNSYLAILGLYHGIRETLLLESWSYYSIGNHKPHFVQYSSSEMCCFDKYEASPVRLVLY